MTENIKYNLTRHESAQYKECGFILLKGVLSKELIIKLIEAADKQNNLQPHEFCFLDNCVKRDGEFLNLIDYPKVFKKVVDILGWNIFLSHSHINITPFCGNENDKSLVQWHRDLSRVNDETCECSPAPMISVKVAYYLTDQMESRMGNLMVVSGSHLKNEEPNFANHTELFVEAGDVVIFDRRLWHAAGANCSKKTRKALFYQYSYRWMRPHDTFSDEFIDAVDDPIRKQLLGYHGERDNGYSYYQPILDDVPLRKTVM
jgi:ectoine hydroxylase-related dioxygenase (phytanoyl-CoA dioxygenase family)